MSNVKANLFVLLAHTHLPPYSSATCQCLSFLGISESNMPFDVSFLVGLGEFVVTVPSQPTHPLSVVVDIVLPRHVHDLVGILLPELILETQFEFTVLAPHCLSHL